MSTLRTNALEGVDAKNSITIVAGAGNVTTTNVQEGLCKAFILFNGTGTPASRDSFNVTSISDGGTGLYTLNLTNAFNDGNHADVGSNANGMVLSHNNGSVTQAGASTSFVNSKNTSGSDFDSEFISTVCNGDLA